VSTPWCIELNQHIFARIVDNFIECGSHDNLINSHTSISLYNNNNNNGPISKSDSDFLTVLVHKISQRSGDKRETVILFHHEDCPE